VVLLLLLVVLRGVAAAACCLLLPEEWHADEAVRLARRIAAGHPAPQGPLASPERGESTLTLTLRHSGSRRSRSPAAAAPLRPPQPHTARRAALAEGPAPGGWSGGGLDGDDAWAEARAAAEAEQKALEADSRERAARAEVGW
jgi:hypothetical protein